MIALLFLAWRAFVDGEDERRLEPSPDQMAQAGARAPERTHPSHPSPGGDEAPRGGSRGENSEGSRAPTDVWTPIYDRRLRGGEATILARLGDAEGLPLDGRSLGRRPVLRLWRRLGPFGLEIHDTRWRRRASEADLGSTGLEPGLFHLEIDGGGYGRTRSSFHVSPDEKLSAEVRFPGRWRVVGLRFIDQDGHPLPYLTDIPEFEERTGTTLPDRSATPVDVLRDPPAVSTVTTTIHTGGFSMSSPNRRRRGRMKFRTLNGVYYVAVIAGVTGFVKLPHASRLYKTKGFLRSDFVGEAWDDHVVRVEKLEGYEAGMERRALANKDDPGGVKAVDARLRNTPPTRPVAPRSTTDPFDVSSRTSRSWTRFLVDLENRPALHLVGVRCRRNASPRQAPLTLVRRQGPLQWTSVRHGETPYVRLTDGRLYRTSWKQLEHTPDGLRVLTPPPQGRRVVLTITAPPTLAGLGRIMTVHLDLGIDFAPRLHVTVPRSLDEVYRIETSLAPEQEEALDGTGTARLVLGFGSDLSEAEKHRITVPLSKIMVGRLLAGRLDLDMTEKGVATPRVAFRCVGAISEGLPWVEGSILPFEDDAPARAMRELLVKRHRAGKAAPTLAGVDEPPEEESEESPDPFQMVRIRAGVRRLLDGLSPTELRARSGEELAHAFPDPRVLRRFLENGSWYDAWNRVRSDQRGFVLAKTPYIVPGRHYVLYLWSKSRDALKPDRRVVFRARPGLTDLGVILLPSY